MATQSPASLKLKELRERANFSVRGLAAAIGMNASTYATYEHNYKKDYLPPDLINRLILVLRQRGEPRILIEELLELAGFGKNFSSEPIVLSGMQGMEPKLLHGTVSDLDRRLDPSADMPVVESKVSGDHCIELRVGADQPANVFVPRPHALAGVRNAIAFYMPDDSMAPWRIAGEPVFLHPSKAASLNTHAFAVTQRQEHGVVSGYLGLFKERTGGGVSLRRYGAADTLFIDASELVWTWRVLEWVEVAGFG